MKIVCALFPGLDVWCLGLKKGEGEETSRGARDLGDGCHADGDGEFVLPGIWHLVG